MSAAGQVNFDAHQHLIPPKCTQHISWPACHPPTCVMAMPLDRLVGMQVNTARPRAREGGSRGSRSTRGAARGVSSRMAARPYARLPAGVQCAGLWG